MAVVPTVGVCPEEQEVRREMLPLWTGRSYNRRPPSPPVNSREGTRSAWTVTFRLYLQT